MIIIQEEDGAIVTDPKKIYIDNDLDGHRSYVQCDGAYGDNDIPLNVGGMIAIEIV